EVRVLGAVPETRGQIDRDPRTGAGQHAPAKIHHGLPVIRQLDTRFSTEEKLLEYNIAAAKPGGLPFVHAVEQQIIIVEYSRIVDRVFPVERRVGEILPGEGGGE